MPKFLTTEDLAKRVGCSARYIRFLAAKGRIPGATRINAKQWIIEDSARLVDVLKSATQRVQSQAPRKKVRGWEIFTESGHFHVMLRGEKVATFPNRLEAESYIETQKD